MPQGRRKVPFSGKAKKEQMLAKRNKDSETKLPNKPRVEMPEDVANDEPSATVVAKPGSDQGTMYTDVALATTAKGRSRYELIFQQESRADLEKRRELARRPYKRLSDEDLEFSIDDWFPGTCDYPKRPEWDRSMAKDKFEANEEKYFRQFVSDMVEKHEQNLSFFELNLETWRQLWRVTEMADVLLLITDARYPMVPPSLIRGLSPKPVVIVLNKIDLIPAGLALAWKSYFIEKFPNVRVTYFTSCPTYNLRKPILEEGLQFRRLRGRISMAKEGALQIFETILALFPDKGHLLNNWREKIETATDDEETSSEPVATDEKSIITVGMVGQPNVGKSSLINSLVGRRVVSVSKTPGHTKHFQTIFITPSVRLCDCPGLVFPSLVPKPLQVVVGCYPIAQTKEPFAVVQFIAERIDLPKILKLPNKDKWTTFDICEAWAEKRGYYTARGHRLDVNRAANHIMRMALEGRLALSLRPPKYKPNEWANHDDVAVIEDVLAIHKLPVSDVAEEEEEPSSEESDGDHDDSEPVVTVSRNKFAALGNDD